MKIPADEQDRIRKILALLASPADGEVLAAARRIVAILEKHSLRPEDLLGMAPTVAARTPAAPGERQPYPARRESPPATTAAQRRGSRADIDVRSALGDQVDVEPAHLFAATILSFKPRLAEKGVEFLNDLIMRRQRKVSIRQEQFLRSLAAQTIQQQMKDPTDNRRNWA